MERPELRGIDKPGDMRTWAATVRRLRGPCCEWCGINADVVGGRAHHVFPRATHPQWALEIWNGRWLCENCHFGIHDSRLNEIWQEELIERGCPQDGGQAYLQPWEQRNGERMREMLESLWQTKPDEARAAARVEWLEEITAGLLTGLPAEMRDRMRELLNDAEGE